VLQRIQTDTTTCFDFLTLMGEEKRDKSRKKVRDVINDIICGGK